MLLAKLLLILKPDFDWLVGRHDFEIGVVHVLMFLNRLDNLVVLTGMAWARAHVGNAELLEKRFYVVP